MSLQELMIQLKSGQNFLMNAGMSASSQQHIYEDLQKLCDAVLLSAIRVDAPKTRTPDMWADCHRRLPAGNAEPGLWRSSRAPYMISIMRACTQPKNKRVIAVMASQMGKT